MQGQSLKFQTDFMKRIKATTQKKSPLPIWSICFFDLLGLFSVISQFFNIRESHVNFVIDRFKLVERRHGQHSKIKGAEAETSAPGWLFRSFFAASGFFLFRGQQIVN